MTSRIEQAARVLYEDDTGNSADDVDLCDQWELDQWRAAAATLHNAGLLATHEEWRAKGETDDDMFETRTYSDACSAYHWAAGGTVEHRWATEWEAVE